MKRERNSVSINDYSKLPITSCLIMLLSGFVRVIYYFRLYAGEMTLQLLLAQITLPLLSVLLFSVFTEGKKIKLTIIPMIMGCAFFIIKALSFGSIHKVLCILLYIFLGLLYVLTVTGVIPSKLPLIISFVLPLCVHIGMDIYEFATYENIVIVDYLPELSVLLIIAALLLLTLSLNVEKNYVDKAKRI